MSINAVTSDPYAYLDRALPGDQVAQYVPATKTKDGQPMADNSGFGEDGFGFDDFLDIINPLQHIPVISSLYREITGDEISPGSRMIGGTIFGGGIGLAVSFVNSAIEDSTGKDVGGHILGLFSSEDDGGSEELLAVAPKADEIQVPAAPLASPPQSLPQALPQTLPPPSQTAVPISLEWKGNKPDLLLNLEKAKSLQSKELTPEQLNAVIRSFHTSPASPITTAPQAAAAYQQSTLIAENSAVPRDTYAFPETVTR